MIKPRTNSFVWDVERDPAIFLYLDPDVTRAKFENTVAHELHHIGFASVRGSTATMLAAAGAPGIHPHAVSPPADRARWDKDLANFNRDVRTLETFFRDIMTRRLATPDTIRAVASTFYGVQGPWYTVGWKMAVVIEEAFGRAELIRCMTDPGLLLSRYNAAAAARNRTHADTLALWSRELVAALGRHKTPPDRRRGRGGT